VTRHPALFAIYTVLTAVFALGTPAEAGGGVRLNFGGPLGTFVATPTPGYGGGRTATQHTKQLKVLSAKRHRIEEARHGKTTSPSYVSPVRYDTAPVAKMSAPITAEDNAAPGLVGRALASDQLPRAETVRTLPPAESIVARDVSLSDAISATPKAAPAKVIAGGTLEKCRKFIPAVGATVTVSCN
jgi:hypothetical protein